jgi:hypothetical protein
LNNMINNNQGKLSNHIMPAACGDHVTEFITASTACTTSGGNPGVKCWTQCMAVGTCIDHVLIISNISIV